MAHPPSPDEQQLLVEQQEAGRLSEYALLIKGQLCRRRGDVRGSLECFQQAMERSNNPTYAKQVARSLYVTHRKFFFFLSCREQELMASVCPCGSQDPAGKARGRR
jgi:hypothetical protein